jgi:hypothetical protein
VSVLDETAELGLGNPLVFAGTAGSAAEAAATTATATITTSASSAATTTTTATVAFASLFSGCFTFHLSLQCLLIINSGRHTRPMHQT